MAYFPTEMGNFPTEMDSGKLGGALAHSKYHVPAAQGSVIYLNGNPDLAHMLGKVEGLGGKVIMPKSPIGSYGFIAMFADTEGNMVGLQSNN